MQVTDVEHFSLRKKRIEKNPRNDMNQKTRIDSFIVNMF